MTDRNRGVLGIVVAAIAVGGLVAFLIYRFPEAVAGRDGQINLTYGLLLLAVVGGSAIVHRRMRPRSAPRHAAIWVAIGAVLLAGYSVRHEAADLGERMLGELLPHQAIERQGAVSIRAGTHGHFVVEAEVDGIAIRFLVDTGASDVVLSPADATRLGFVLASLSYTRSYQTANGVVFGAPVRLARLSIGPIELGDVRASVNGSDMKRSLLGMSFLGRLSGYEVRGDTLILRP